LKNYILQKAFVIQKKKKGELAGQEQVVAVKE